MRIILTKTDLIKPLKINSINEEEGDRERVLKEIIKDPSIIEEIVITNNEIHITTK